MSPPTSPPFGRKSAGRPDSKRERARNIDQIFTASAPGAGRATVAAAAALGELAETAACVVPLPDIFSDYLQAGRVDVGFLGAAQIARFGNLNSTVIGSYEKPRTRLPGAGGATEIAAHARQVFVVMKATTRSFVPRLDFQTSGGHFEGRSSSGARGAGPAAVVTDVGILKPQAGGELALAAAYPGVSSDEAHAAVGWKLTVAQKVETIAAPTAAELGALRALEARTAAAHREPVRLPT